MTFSRHVIVLCFSIIVLIASGCGRTLGTRSVLSGGVACEICTQYGEVVLVLISDSLNPTPNTVRAADGKFLTVSDGWVLSETLKSQTSQ